MKYIVITGNPVDGCEYFGPFKTHEKATDYAERYLDGDWWVTTLYKPEKS